MPSAPTGKIRHFWSVAVILLLAVVFIVPAAIMSEKSPTFDEVSHLPAGYSYLIERAIRYNPQHPPVVKEICALPLLFLGIRYPAIPPENEWVFGKEFLFRQNAQRIIFWGRLFALLLSLGMALVVLLWATNLWGWAGGLLGLFLYALDPTITAHSQLVTTDVGVACFSVLYLWTLRSYLRHPNWTKLLLSGLTLGMALGAKFSAVVLIPVSFVLMSLVPFLGDWGANVVERRKTPSALASFRNNLAALCLITAVASVFVWATYFFPSDPLFYWKGIQAVNRDRGLQPLFYLMGELKPGGWKAYFLIAWLVKTPIPTLLLLGSAFLMLARGRRANWLDEAFLLIPVVAYFLFYSLFADNLGVRYLIPCFPFLFIFVGRIGQQLCSARGVYKLLAGVLLAWNVSEYVTIAPDHLSYFNQIAGGSEKGLEWLSDSNLDWGQGLIQLRRFIQEQKIVDYAYFYFGTADPEYYGIRGRRIEDFDFFIRPTRGIVIISSHLVTRARIILDRVFGNGPLNWLRHQKPAAIVGHAYYVYEIS